MSDYKKHYLSDKIDKRCPLNHGACDEFCAWFDHEHQDCRMIGGFWKVREGINEMTDMLIDIEKSIDFQTDMIREAKNVKRAFKF